MGLTFSFLKDWWYGVPPTNIAMVGLDAAGKTSILYRMKEAKEVVTIPTIDIDCGHRVALWQFENRILWFNLETISFRNITFSIWDMGGGDKLRPLQYREQTRGMQALIWVVDSTDKERFSQSKEELDCLLGQEHLKGTPLLVFNAKSDLPNSVPSTEVAEHLGLLELKDREWCIMKCSSKTGVGLWEGFEKLYHSLTGAASMNGVIN